MGGWVVCGMGGWVTVLGRFGTFKSGEVKVESFIERDTNNYYHIYLLSSKFTSKINEEGEGLRLVLEIFCYEVFAEYILLLWTRTTKGSLASFEQCACHHHAKGLVVGDDAVFAPDSRPEGLTDSAISGNTGEKLRALDRNETSSPALFPPLPQPMPCPPPAPWKDPLNNNLDRNASFS